ncbi:Flp pilus assembly protein CpaB [Streptomyces sp. TR06-5]|uniref:Flp pilus assembly protein CpaB n=1 Tax=unclassified Streptomyces TaxID=2593676 RepID=UPI0039A25291
MNSRQRRGVILLLVSTLLAFAAFAGVVSVISDVRSKVGPETTAYELTSDVEPYTELRKDQFRRISMPERWLPRTAVTDLGEVRGKIATNRLRTGSLLQTDMLTDRPDLEPGQQEIAIMIDAATGVAGKITPGATVNVYATFDGTEQDATSTSRLLIDNARVIDVGEITALQPDRDDSSPAGNEAVPITFALKTEDAQRLAYAESFATHVRLALVAPGSDTTVRPEDRTYTLAGDK